MQENPSLKLKVSKLRCAVVGLRLGFVTNSIIYHLFPALGVTAEPSSPSFSITSSYPFYIFLLFLTGLKVKKKKKIRKNILSVSKYLI